MTQPDTDVLIIGAGLSGIGAAVHLGKRCPDKSYRIIEQRSAIGGTWDLFRYPGIRSDSDMHTLGFNFKPWTDAKAIADGPSIRKYVNDTADEYGVRDHISFDTKIVAANWSTPDQAWHVTSENKKTGERETTTTRFLFMCGGYYSYDTGYRPDFPGEEQFKGKLIHPQFWPEDYDYSGKKVVIIGSGATAMTLVPAMTDKAAHVTMLQRSPTYVVSRPARDKAANFLRKILPDSWAYGIIRWRNVLFQQYFFRQTRAHPEKARERLLGMVKEELPDYDVETHFTPTYNPWDQRLCLVPDSDLFDAIKSGKASVETDHIETFTENGIKLKSGKELEADVVVTATGLQLQFLNGVDVSLDGVKVDPGKLLNYKGVMLSNMPNLAVTFGYTNASWTLKADLTSEYVCRLINLMDEKGATSVMPRLDAFPNETEPFVDFSSGYFQRVMDQFPRQHTEAPWKLHQSYFTDRKNLRNEPIEDGVMAFTTAGEAGAVLQAAE
ncbi:MAG: NAD(P)/FAD-dependent oxidoreductase [Hyphomonas sp.]|nr:NAD(P)/FAD-dependent oxidoreductase [Hyphomonas sp.]